VPSMLVMIEADGKDLRVTTGIGRERRSVSGDADGIIAVVAWMRETLRSRMPGDTRPLCVEDVVRWMSMRR